MADLVEVMDQLLVFVAVVFDLLLSNFLLPKRFHLTLSKEAELLAEAR